VKFDFAYAGGRGAGGTGIIYVDGAKAGEGKIDKTATNTFGVDETADVGEDINTPVVAAYHGRSKFTGRIQKITIETAAVK
jgi:arylsulfatase